MIFTFRGRLIYIRIKPIIYTLCILLAIGVVVAIPFFVKHVIVLSHLNADAEVTNNYLLASDVVDVETSFLIDIDGREPTTQTLSIQYGLDPYYVYVKEEDDAYIVTSNDQKYFKGTMTNYNDNKVNVIQAIDYEALQEMGVPTVSEISEQTQIGLPNVSEGNNNTYSSHIRFSKLVSNESFSSLRTIYAGLNEKSIFNILKSDVLLTMSFNETMTLSLTFTFDLAYTTYVSPNPAIGSTNGYEKNVVKKTKVSYVSKAKRSESDPIPVQNKNCFVVMNFDDLTHAAEIPTNREVAIPYHIYSQNKTYYKVFLSEGTHTFRANVNMLLKLYKHPNDELTLTYITPTISSDQLQYTYQIKQEGYYYFELGIYYYVNGYGHEDLSFNVY